MLLRAFFKFILFGVCFSGLFFVGKNTKIIGSGRKLFIGRMSKIESHCIIQTTSVNGIKIGKNCTIGDYVMIRPSSYYGGKPGYGLVIGDRSAIGVRSYIGCSGKIVIGSDVIIGPNCTIIAENHIFNDKEKPIKEQGVTNSGILINNDVWIGANVTILDGVSIGSHSVIAAGSVVTRNVESNSLVAGIPARKIRDI